MRTPTVRVTAVVTLVSRVLAFFSTGSRDDSLSVIQSKFKHAFGTTLDEVEGDWLAMLQ